MAESSPALMLDVSSPARPPVEVPGSGGDYGSAGYDMEDADCVHVMVNPETIKDPVFLAYGKDSDGGMMGLVALLNYETRETAQQAYVDMHGEDALGFTVETTVEDYRKLVEMTRAMKDSPAPGDYYAGEFQLSYGGRPKKKRYPY